MFPDVAFDGEYIVVVYVTCPSHMDRGHSEIRVAKCKGEIGVHDHRGRQWDFNIVAEAPQGRYYNSPRIISTGKGKFTIVCDLAPKSKIGPDFMTDYGALNKLRIVIFESYDFGLTWKDRWTSAEGLCPSLFIQDDEVKIISQVYDPIKQRRHLCVWSNRTVYTDGWEHMTRSDVEPSELCDLCEGTLVREGETYVLIMRSNSMDGQSSYRSMSTDGLHWSKPQPFFIPGGGHRPTVIKLEDGNYFASFRFYAGAGYDQNTFMALFPSWTLTAPRNAQRAIIRPLDFNPRQDSDQGYTGACELPDGTIFVVNYLNQDFSATGIYYYLVRKNHFLTSFGPDSLKVLQELKG